jgi:hypothetical protein
VYPKTIKHGGLYMESQTLRWWTLCWTSVDTVLVGIMTFRRGVGEVYLRTGVLRARVVDMENEPLGEPLGRFPGPRNYKYSHV